MSANPIMDLANDLVALVKAEKYEEAYTKYYTDESSSVEPFSRDGSSDPVTTGVSNLLTKAKKWAEKSTTVALEVSAPSVPNGNQFIVWMSITTKDNETGKQSKGVEYVLYTVNDDMKIIEERFFYISEGEV